MPRLCNLRIPRTTRSARRSWLARRSCREGPLSPGEAATVRSRSPVALPVSVPSKDSRGQCVPLASRDVTWPGQRPVDAVDLAHPICWPAFPCPFFPHLLRFPVFSLISVRPRSFRNRHFARRQHPSRDRASPILLRLSGRRLPRLRVLRECLTCPTCRAMPALVRQAHFTGKR